MTTREQEIISKTVVVLRAYLDPAEIWLFGSRGKKTADKGSDFDFAVDVPRPDVRISRKINEEMAVFLGLYQADIVYLPNAKKEFQEIVRTTGRKVYERI